MQEEVLRGRFCFLFAISSLRLTDWSFLIFDFPGCLLLTRGRPCCLLTRFADNRPDLLTQATLKIYDSPDSVHRQLHRALHWLCFLYKPLSGERLCEFDGQCCFPQKSKTTVCQRVHSRFRRIPKLQTFSCAELPKYFAENSKLAADIEVACRGIQLTDLFVVCTPIGHSLCLYISTKLVHVPINSC